MLKHRLWNINSTDGKVGTKNEKVFKYQRICSNDNHHS